MYTYIEKKTHKVMSTGNSVVYETDDLYTIRTSSQPQLGSTYLNGHFEPPPPPDTTKYEKEEKIKALQIEITSGAVFDGDEISQARMARAIQIAEITGQTSTEWKMADNSIMTITLDELKDALASAGRAMSDIWLQ